MRSGGGRSPPRLRFWIWKLEANFVKIWKLEVDFWKLEANFVKIWKLEADFWKLEADLKKMEILKWKAEKNLNILNQKVGVKTVWERLGSWKSISKNFETWSLNLKSSEVQMDAGTRSYVGFNIWKIGNVIKY